MGYDLRTYILHKNVTPWHEQRWDFFEDPNKILNLGLLDIRRGQTEYVLFVCGDDDVHKLPAKTGGFPPIKNPTLLYELKQIAKGMDRFAWFKPQEIIDHYEKHKEYFDDDADSICIKADLDYKLRIFVDEIRKLKQYDDLDNFIIICFWG